MLLFRRDILELGYIFLCQPTLLNYDSFMIAFVSFYIVLQIQKEIIKR
jgi:hypothetical protein